MPSQCVTSSGYWKRFALAVYKRQGQYRDIAAWVDSLERIMSYPAEALLPGHMLPVLGHDRITEVLCNFKEAIRYILDETLACISQGLSQDETAARVVLPEAYRSLPYLQAVSYTHLDVYKRPV